MKSDFETMAETKPKSWHFLLAGGIAIVLVIAYAYFSWTATTPVWWLPEKIANTITWVTAKGEKAETSADAKAASDARASDEDLRAKLLDLRGKLGDSFGPLNALLSSLGFIALLYSIRMQSAISAKQDRLQQRQRFEELFSLAVQANREALRTISYVEWVPDVPSGKMAFETELMAGLYRKRIGNSWIGKEALLHIWEREIYEHFLTEVEQLIDNSVAEEIKKQYLASTPEGGDPRLKAKYVEGAFDQASAASRQTIYSCLKRSYEHMYEANEYQFDAYYRTLYRVFELVSRGEEDYGLNTKQIREYAAMARAQLSWYELALVLMNCVALDFEKAGRLYSRFALFDNLTIRNGLVTTLAKKYIEWRASQDSLAVGNDSPPRMSDLDPCAFDTALARSKFDAKNAQQNNH